MDAMLAILQDIPDPDGTVLRFYHYTGSTSGFRRTRTPRRRDSAAWRTSSGRRHTRRSSC